MSNSGGKLTIFQLVMLVLKKLRLNLEEKDLAYRFNCCFKDCYHGRKALFTNDLVQQKR